MYTAGSLLGEYWDNIWLHGVPDVVKEDQFVDMDWGTDELITTYAGDYISIRWTGLLLPPVTEEYTFYISGDDGVRLYISDELKIDEWDT